jgi:hypothetical protein
LPRTKAKEAREKVGDVEESKHPSLLIIFNSFL